MLGGDDRDEALALASDETWQDVFCFVVDGTEAPLLPELLLDDLLVQGGQSSLALIAYAIGTKAGSEPPLPTEVRRKYSDARLEEDLRLTPIAASGCGHRRFLRM
jgi:hypothetical protein